MTIAATFQIEYLQFLDEHGKVVAPLPAFAQDPAALIPLYKAMVLMRTYDAKAIALQRTGQLGTYASLLGKEAVDAGVGAAMEKDDVFLCTYRENGVQILRGVTMRELLLYWGGDERGSDFAGPRRDFPVCITIASQCLHAVGVALRDEAAQAAARGGVHARRRRDLQGRFLRKHQRRRRVAAAGGVRRHQQPVGDLGAAQGADRGANAGAESDRRRHRRRAGRRQRRDRGAITPCAKRSPRRARAAARR